MRYLFTAFLMIILAGPASPCSTVSMWIPGTLTSDGSVVFAFSAEDWERPRLWRLKSFDAAGETQGSVDLELDAPDANVRLLGIDKANHVWMLAECFSDAGGEDCNQLLRISASGKVVERRAVPDGEARWGLRWDGERLLTSIRSEHGWVPHELGQPAGTSVIRARPPESLCDTCRNSRWVSGVDGSALMVADAGESIVLARFDDQGELVYNRSYPRADRSNHGSSTNQRIGPISYIELGKEGSVYFGQRGIAADCTAYQPSSLVILDPAGNIERVVRTPGDVADTLELGRERGELNEGLMALMGNGKVLRLGRGGEEIDPWSPELIPSPHAGKDYETLKAEAAALDRSAAPEDWVRLHPVAEAGKQEEIITWVVEAGPGIYERIVDPFFQNYAARLCAGHSEVAAAEVLRRFTRSIGRHKDRWLPGLAACFADEAPTAAYAYAVERAKSDSYDAKEALRTWGESGGGD